MASSEVCHNCNQCPYRTISTFCMKIHLMTHDVPENERLFNCSNPMESFRCLQCANFHTHNVVNMKQHVKAGHTLPKSAEKLYECESCKSQTFSKYLDLRHKLLKVCLKNDQIKSEDSIPEEITNNIQWFECDRYSYKNRTKSNLKKQTNSRYGNVAQFKCDYCQFETKYKQSLRCHVLTKHTDADESQWFKCELCSYKSKSKSNLKQHMDYKHRERESFKCDFCQFETKYKRALRTHISNKHIDDENIQWFQCEHCSYKGKSECNLKQHTEYRHTPPDMIRWFECEHCAHRSKTKSDMKRHVDYQHGARENLKCDHCLFETKFKHCLKRHILRRHADLENTSTTKKTDPVLEKFKKC